MQALGRLSKLNKVTSMLIHRHQGMPGNKEAHRLAREGAVEFQFTDEIYERAI
jgi:ribonuclease HI